MKSSLKNVTPAQKYPEFLLTFGSMSCLVWKNYARQWWPGMTKQTCNQYSTMRYGVQVL